MLKFQFNLNLFCSLKQNLHKSEIFHLVKLVVKYDKGSKRKSNRNSLNKFKDTPLKVKCLQFCVRVVIQDSSQIVQVQEKKCRNNNNKDIFYSIIIMQLFIFSFYDISTYIHSNVYGMIITWHIYLYTASSHCGRSKKSPLI